MQKPGHPSSGFGRDENLETALVTIINDIISNNFGNVENAHVWKYTILNMLLCVWKRFA